MNDNPFSEPEDNDRTILRKPGAAPLTPPVQPAPAAGGTARWPAPSDAPANQVLPGEAHALPKVGSSAMAAAAAPLLDLLARIGTGGQAVQVGNADQLRERAVQALHVFEAECRSAQVSDEQLRAAHYALCAALDDTALATPWGQASGWAARSLSSTFHQDVKSGERFFDMLAGLQREPGRYRPALEICYLCLALGLRGKYRLDPRGSGELERIREGLYQLLTQLNGPWERELSPHWRGVDAPHRGPPRGVPAWVAAAVALGLLGVGWILASGHVNAGGDALQLALTQLPPKTAPTIRREVALVRPAAAPAAPDAVAKLRTFLAPEISEGLVAVEGDAQRLLIRVLSTAKPAAAAGQRRETMFDSGSADLNARFATVFNRIGQALRDEPGRVTVLGHSDNQPIETRRFPSNFALSEARAKAALAILASASGQPDRFQAVGRADTEPLDTSPTEAARSINRRIEVVVTRAGGQ
jgi:type VI secretion system protein ImpK